MSQVVVEIGADSRAFQRAVNGLPQSVTKVSGQMKAAFAGIGIGVVGKQMLDVVVSMDRMTRGMTTLEGSAAGAEKRLSELREAAMLPGVDFEQAVKADIKLRSVGLSAQESRTAIIEFGNALSLAGGTSEDLDGVILALTQIISKGKVSAEEINQIAERVPQVRAVMKDMFGTADTEVLQKMNIDAETFVNTLVGGFGNLDRATAGLDEKLSDISTAIKTSVSALAGGFFNVGVEGAQSLTSALDQNIDKIEKLGAVLGNLASTTGSIFGEMASIVEGWAATVSGNMLWLNGSTREEANAAVDAVLKRGSSAVSTVPGPAVVPLPQNYTANDEFTWGWEGLRAKREREANAGTDWGSGWYGTGRKALGGASADYITRDKFIGTPMMDSVQRMITGVASAIGPMAEAMGNLLTEQSQGLKGKASELGSAAFGDLRGDVDTSFGRGSSVNPLTNGASRQISEMMKQSAILEKQAAKLDTSNNLLQAIQSAIKSQSFAYN